MRGIGILFIGLGGIFMILGLFLLSFPKFWGWLGHLPGDLRFNIGERGFVFIPLGTALVISLFLSFLASLLSWLLRWFR
jgi:hypothetical protein